MILHPKRTPILFIPWALAVAMICFGSLINFHQYRIWHQPLLPKIIACKKDVELTQTDIVLAKLRLDREQQVIHLCDQADYPEFLQAGNFPVLFNTVCINAGERIPDLLLACSHGLRAPPLV